MTTFRLPTNNEQIARDLMDTLESSNGQLRSALESLAKPPTAPVAPQTDKGSNLGPCDIGQFRERLSTSISRRAT